MEIAGHVVPVGRLVAAACYLALGAGVMVVVWPGARSARPAPAVSSPAVALRFPAPPAGATVLARQAGGRVLAAALRQEGGRMIVQVSVVGLQGNGATAKVRIGGLAATACGPGCYRATVPAASRVAIRADAIEWDIAVPQHAEPAAAIVARAAQTWRALRSVAWSETLASDSAHSVRSTWTAQAPDRVAYVVEKGGSSDVIGHSRWDKRGGGEWTRSAQDPPVHQPVPFWTRATDAHVIARTPGRAVVTFYDPGTPGWFRIVVDTKTSRTVALDMTATAHFMHDRYTRFDHARVEAPR